MYAATPLCAGEEVGLGIIAQKAKYIFMSRHQNTGQNHNLKIDEKFLRKYGKIRKFVDDSNVITLY
jgi:hypothetical protein